MTAGEAPVSGKVTLTGIALIWMIAQVLLVVAHDFWISSGTYRHTSRERCCGVDTCVVPGPIAIQGKGRLRRQDGILYVRKLTPDRDAKT
jgi:hypothetical protein